MPETKAFARTMALAGALKKRAKEADSAFVRCLCVITNTGKIFTEDEIREAEKLLWKIFNGSRDLKKTNALIRSAADYRAKLEAYRRKKQSQKASPD